MFPRSARLAWLLYVLSVVGCGDGGDDDADAEGDNGPPPALEDVNVVDYFPMEPGMRWTYDVECPTGARTLQWNLAWPAGGGQVFIKKYDATSSGGTGELIYRVREVGVPPAGEYNPTYHSGVLVDVESDTLGLYMNIDTDVSGLPVFLQPSQIYWTRSQEQAPDIVEVQLFELGATPEGALPGSQPRQNVHLLCSPYLESVEDIASQVRLYVVGYDTEVPGYEGEHCLHYSRRYGSEDYVLFSEDLWFAKGVGLVRVEQTTYEEITLIQSLRSFEQDTDPLTTPDSAPMEN